MIDELFRTSLANFIRYKLIGGPARFCFLGVLLGASFQSNGAWLSMCAGLPLSALENQEAGYLAHVFNVQEKVILLQLTALQPENSSCETRELPVSADKLAWAGFTEPATLSAKQIALQGREFNGRFKVSEIIASGDSEAQPPLSSVKPQPSGKAPRFSPLRASWFWEPASWLDTPWRIFDTQTSLALKRIYITVPVNEGLVRHTEQLRQFLDIAHQRGLQVWAVLGDPQAVLDQGRQHFLALASAYQMFNASSSAQQRLDGLQLDIEPYLLPGYQLNPAAWQQKQAKTVNAVHQIAPSLPLDMVLPFWLDPLHGAGAALLDNVEASIASITLMNYRTDPEQIREFADKILAWGELRQKAVYIALESLSMDEEERRMYTRAQSGELWRFDFKAAPVFLLLQDQAQDLPGGMAYRFVYSRKIDGSSTSFFQQPGALKKLLPALEKQFSAWSSFAGMALHGHEQQRKDFLLKSPVN